ncbi:MAG: hypothetical protein KAT65_30160, partial [Methanophagales archaeon]|nr:hypothetical protein [Methanophagales archaeon]
MNSYSEELACRVSGENKRELEKLREEIFLQLQTIVRRYLKELREDEDLEDPSVNIISDRILVESEYLKRIAEEVIAKASKKRLVFVVGEAGVGKSKLLYLIWKKLKERREEVGYLLNLRETPLYHGVLFYDDFKSEYFDPLIFPALTTKKLVITIRDFEYKKLRSNSEIKKLEESGAVLPVYLNKEELEREFLLKLAEKYLEAHELRVSEKVIDKIVAKSEGLSIYITTLIEHVKRCASTGVKIEETIERVPSGIFKLIGEILYSTFYKPPEKEVWALSTLAALAHWQGLMHEKHLEALKQGMRSKLKKLDDSVIFLDLSNYEYLLNKVGSFYRFKHWTWFSVLSTIYDGDLEEFGNLKDNLGIIRRYLRYSELDFDELLKASYFKALEGSKDKEKLGLFKGYLFLPSRFLSDLEMYEEAVEKLEGFFEEEKTPEIAAVLASGLVNLIADFVESREPEKAEEKETRLEELYEAEKTPEIAAELARGLYNLITYFVKSGELEKAEEKEARLKELYEAEKTPEVSVWLASGLVNLIAGFVKSGEPEKIERAEEKEARLKELYETEKTPEIAAELATGLYNLITYFGESGELKKAEEKETRLKELYETEKTPEIAADLAKGLVNLI